MSSFHSNSQHNSHSNSNIKNSLNSSQLSSKNNYNNKQKQQQKQQQKQEQRHELSEEELEYNHWYDIMRTFLMYHDFNLFEFNERKKHFNYLNNKYKSMLPNQTLLKFDQLINASNINQQFFNEVVNFQDYGFAPRTHKSQKVDKFNGKPIHSSQMHRNQAVLHSLAREWSVNGSNERETTFTPLLQALQSKLPVTSSNLYRQRVLVPGCGLARLPLEIAGLGYACEANEYSMFMLTASHYVLNNMLPTLSIQVYPWIDRVSNIVNLSDILEPVLIPDVSPLDIINPNLPVASNNDNLNEEPSYHRFSMAAGNFVELYGGEAQAGQWDAIVTCFFLDTAPVVME